MLGGLVRFESLANEWHTTPLQGPTTRDVIYIRIGWDTASVWFRKLHSLFAAEACETISVADRNSSSDGMAESFPMNFELFVNKFQVAAVRKTKTKRTCVSFEMIQS